MTRHGWVSDPVVDPDEIAPGAFEFICAGCRLVAHVGGSFAGLCRDCVADCRHLVNQTR